MRNKELGLIEPNSIGEDEEETGSQGGLMEGQYGSNTPK